MDRAVWPGVKGMAGMKYKELSSFQEAAVGLGNEGDPNYKS